MFNRKIVIWYEKNKRTLPWRDTKSAYRIWLSEIILQQTRVAQGLGYFEKFIETYPTLKELALANEEEVLRLWQGLGYYSRARNLLYTARFIQNELGGLFPTTYKELLKLKGVGPYTAAAIASFAYGEPVAVVDGNVFRVLARVFGIEEDIASPKGQKVFQKLAQELILHDQPSIYNQAIMEFGALQCTPVNPKCTVCPLVNECVAFEQRKQDKLPIKKKKIKIKHRYFYYFIIEWEDKIVLKKRTGKDIWINLYDFPLIETKKAVTSIDTLFESSDFGDLLSTGTLKVDYQEHKHVLSHQKIYAIFSKIRLSNLTLEDQKLTFYTKKEVDELPKPVLIDNYLKEHYR